jgi:hypothetical protein
MRDDDAARPKSVSHHPRRLSMKAPAPRAAIGIEARGTRFLRGFVWTASAEAIVAKVGRCLAILETAH